MSATATANDFAQLFPESQYAVDHDVPIVDEHVRRNGTPITRDDLLTLVKNNNERIEDTGDYVPLTIGHSTDDGPQPPVVGFAGPFKLAKIGRKNPRWAMVAENWAIEKSSLDEAKKNPRRSTEIWFNKEGKPQFVDPVALLGAVTPRRTLGLKLHARGHDDLICEHYEMAYAAGGSGANTRTPSSGCDPRDDLVSKMVNAMEATDVFKWCRSKMSEEGSDNASLQAVDDDGGADDDGTPTGAGDGNPKSGSEKKPMSDDAKKPEKGSDDKPKEKNAAGGELTVERLALVESERNEYRDKYLAAEKELNSLRGSQKEITDRVAALEKNKLESNRRSKLRDLQDAGWTVDLNAEMADCSDMTNEQFDRHLKRIERSYPRVPIGEVLPAPIRERNANADGDMATRERNAKAAGELARKENIDFGTALKRVEAESATAS